MDITVVGAGVVGLTAAVTLTEAGHRVQVIAAATGDATTSAVAGAIWLPFQAGPPASVNRWAARTRAWLTGLAAADPTAGVDLLDVLVLDAAGPPGPAPWWADAVGPLERITTDLAEAPAGWRFRAPRIDPRLHLPWLERQLPCPIQRATVARLADLPGDAVVNATGLGAAALTGDPALYGLVGQIVVTAPGGLDLATSVCDDRVEALDPTALFYTIPRRDEVVVGGTAQRHPPDRDAPAPDPAIRARILAHARQLGLAPGPVLRERVGVRPCRPTVRVERDPGDAWIIHDYGHGGAGYTLARGCAEEVVALVSGSTGTR